MGNDLHETDGDVPDVAATAGSPVPLVMLAGDEDALCIDELCVSPAPAEEVTT